MTTFLKDLGGDLTGTSIHLNSAGGNLFAALEMGRIIRAAGLTTVVAETAGHFTQPGGGTLIDDFLDSDAPICASACVFAFVGGANRVASTRTDGEEAGYQKIGRLAVHQFYSFARDSETFDSSERVKDQLRTAALLEYLVEMGISADLLSRALSVPPGQDLYWLSEEDLKEFGIDTFATDITPVLRGYANGVGVVEFQKSTRRGTYRYEFFCDNRQQAMLKLTFTDFEYPIEIPAGTHAPKDAGRFLQGLRVPLPGTPVITTVASNTGPGGPDRVVEVVFRGDGSDVGDLTGNTDFHFFHDGLAYEAYLALDMNVTLPQPFDGFALLPRLCLR